MEVTKVKIYPYNVKYGKLGKCQVILDHELLLMIFQVENNSVRLLQKYF